MLPRFALEHGERAIDTEARTVTAYRLQSGLWVETGVFGDEREAHVEPFAEIARHRELVGVTTSAPERSRFVHCTQAPVDFVKVKPLSESVPISDSRVVPATHHRP